MGLSSDNDIRGWEMSAVSGVACVLGSGIICIDILLRKCFYWGSFEISSSRTFLSSSLSLSAGVMFFSSLYSMLPTSMSYLVRAGLSDAAATYTLTGLFLAGFLILEVFSSLLHRYMPSHVVDCRHDHEPSKPDLEHGNVDEERDLTSERTPLLCPSSAPAQTATVPSLLHRKPPPWDWKGHLGRWAGGMKRCDGPCYGYSQTCGQECTKTLEHPVTSTFIDGTAPSEAIPPSVPPSQAGAMPTSNRLDAENSPASAETVQRILDAAPNDELTDCFSAQMPTSTSELPQVLSLLHAGDEFLNADDSIRETASKPSQHSLPTSQHHHHVPQNSFLSIGLQTSLAIALHKLPEGFITYATNHANPTLGFTIFLAISIHNITDGFVMALPLYLALNSRWQAMLWSSLLGGISQPAGAGLAALWIASTHRTDPLVGPSWGVYGGMFAVTAGIMAAVALQLFSEGLNLTHRRNLCIWSAAAGMGVIGLGYALSK